MSFIHHIEACNRHDLTGFRPFVIDGARIGWVRHALAETLPVIEPAFAVTPAAIGFVSEVATFETRTAAFARVGPRLVDRGAVRAMRGECFPVLTGWGRPPLARIDRGLVSCFGIGAYGVHVNGFVRRADGGLSLWIARRALNRVVDPGKFDNMVAGGQPFGLTIAENVLKESFEEAGLPAAVAARAQSAGVITYMMETASGLKPDTMFVYDLDMTDGVVPHNQDGEVADFHLMPIEEVGESVRDGRSWKFNVKLVVTDFLIRHGWIKPDDPDYVAIVRGLHQ